MSREQIEVGDWVVVIGGACNGTATRSRIFCPPNSVGLVFRVEAITPGEEAFVCDFCKARQVARFIQNPKKNGWWPSYWLRKLPGEQEVREYDTQQRDPVEANPVEGVSAR